LKCFGFGWARPNTIDYWVLLCNMT
jgi:hypothetical protein